MQLVELKGVEELNKKLESVAYDVKYRGGRFALRKAAQAVRDTAKENAIREKLEDASTGRSISLNISERWNGRLFKRTGDLGFRVGVQGGAKSQKTNPDQGAGGPTFHWRFFEMGTEKMAARPFMRPALEENAQAVTDIFMREYAKAIDRAIKRAGK